MSLLPFLHRVASHANLSAAEAHTAMTVLLRGEASPVETSAFLVALRMKCETAAELAGFARAMREQGIAVSAGDVVDNCGTGGDGSGTFNISTTAAFVMAGAGARVAKHGNRSISSATGAADVLEALGIPLTSTAEDAERSLQQHGVSFLFAPAFHPSIRHVQPVRRELKMRTVFNLLGPLVNPAGARRQVIGAPSVAAAELMAEAVALLGAERVFVVHGFGGLDEISTLGPTEVFEVVRSLVTRVIWEPEDFGVARGEMSELQGGDAARNAALVRAILDGETGPRRDIVVANAAAGLLAAGIAANLKDGVKRASASIDSGAARAKLKALRP